MNGERINHILSLDPYAGPIFKGFCSPDLPFPKVRKGPAIFVLNTAPSWTRGEHWCIACLRSDKSCIFFDPYGKSPDAYQFTDRLLKICEKKIQYNILPVQGNLSKTCGHHCIFFALHFARKVEPETIMTFYDVHNKRKNDNMVFDFIRLHAGNILAAIEP